MGLKLTNLWMTAAWREAQRVGATRTDVDHLYLGLLAIGGSAARMLGRRGVTLTSARRRVTEAMDADLATLGIDASAVRTPPPPPLHAMETRPDLPLTPRAEALAAKAMKGADTFALLKALMEEPSGVARRLVHADGVTPQDLAPELRQGAEDPLSPETVDPDPALLPGRTRAQRIQQFLAVPAEQAADRLADPASLAWWAYDPAKSEVSADGERVTHSQAGRKLSLRLHQTRRTEGDVHVVTWIHEALDGRYAGEPLTYDRFEFRPAPGGCELTRTSGRRTFGVLGGLLAPIIDRMSGLGMVYSTAAIAYGVSGP